MDLNFRLFNCDRTYNLDKVKELISKVRSTATVEQRYFGLPRMKDLCNELNEGGKLSGYAVFVVHAHESRLSLNEQNAGIGYAKLYRTLLDVMDGRVLIVIGGDDNYKEDEQDESFLSKWAWRKICSQFTEDYMNGIKSFIFSWDDKHNPIHEEALEFYLDPNTSAQKFVPRPKPKIPKIPKIPKPQPPNADSSKLKDLPRAAIEQKLPLDKVVPPQHSQGRQLPPPPSITSQTPKREVTTLPQPAANTIPCPLDHTSHPLEVPQSTVQLTISPTVHVLPFLSGNHARQAVVDVVREVFNSLSFSSNPKVPDIHVEHLSYHCKTYNPDYIVLVSEYGDFMDLEHLPKQVLHLRGLLESVKENEGTKLIFVVMGSTNYIEEELSSDSVDQTVLYLNHDTLQPGKLMVLSWNRKPYRVHREVLREQFSCPRNSAILEKYRPIQRPGRRSEEKVPVSTQVVRRLLKITEVGPGNSRYRSLQVYGYHSQVESFWAVHKFIEGLDIHCTPGQYQLQAGDVLQCLTSGKPEFVVFSTDIDLFQETEAVEETIKTYWRMCAPLIAELKGIILLLLGDNNCIDGCLVSSTIEGYVQHFTSKLPLNPNKVTVLSWKDKPFLSHQDKMKILLTRPKEGNPARSSHRPQEKFVQIPANPSPTGLEFDPKRGYLRYRASLVHGRVHEVIYCNLAGWSPDEVDLRYVHHKFADEPKAVIEFWADTPHGHTHPPVVTKEDKNWLPKVELPFSLPSFSSSSSKKASSKSHNA